MTAPHQQRVIDEHAELSDRVEKLSAFIAASAIFPKLDAAERSRLRRQLALMSQYADVLAERIKAFGQGVSL